MYTISGRILSVWCLRATVTKWLIWASWYRVRIFSIKAKEEQVDIIGLSGLITPSLDEMVYVASEMQRLGMKQPLLIGGATTSPVHTAVKIDPARSNGPSIYVTDASRAIGTVTSLFSDDERPLFVETIKAKYQRMRDHRVGGPPKPRYPIQVARSHAHKLQTPAPQAPSFTGTKVFDDCDLSLLARYIDWTPYFVTWKPGRTLSKNPGTQGEG